jgi:hypothetical protein
MQVTVQRKLPSRQLKEETEHKVEVATNQSKSERWTFSPKLNVNNKLT